MTTPQTPRTAAFALCGSFCSFDAVLPQIAALVQRGWTLLPILSYSAAGQDTRFGTAAALRKTLQQMTGHPPMTTLQQVEPLGPKHMAEMLIIAPATGTTLAMLAAGISATPVTLAAKSLLRGGKPVVVAPSSNDALTGTAPALAQLLRSLWAGRCPAQARQPEKRFHPAAGHRGGSAARRAAAAAAFVIAARRQAYI